jgi:two-component system, NarL family, response regulator LiaR
MTIRVLIVDDFAIVRQGLRTFVGLDAEFEVVGEAADGAEGLRLARRLRPDVVLMDLLMPEMDGVTATQIIRSELPEVEVLALTSVLEDAAVVGAVRAGAIGYLLKDAEQEELGRAIRAAARGQVYLSQKAAARLMREVRAPENPIEMLSQREVEVLRLLARGLANKDIARDLGITEKTAKAHVSSILGKLGLQSRTQAALYAGRIGLVPVDQLGAEPIAAAPLPRELDRPGSTSR